MALHTIKKGLDVPIKGEPKPLVREGNNVETVALLGGDYIGMKPTMAVVAGDNVKLGQVLFADKKNPVIKYTSPGAGKVIEINRGEKRFFFQLLLNSQEAKKLPLSLSVRESLIIYRKKKLRKI